MSHKPVKTSVPTETAVLVSVISKEQNAVQVKEYLEELQFLAETAGARTKKQYTQSLTRPDPKTYVGSGKLHEIHTYVEDNEIDMVIFDDELTPSQLRNIERELECRILDRNNLILDIFAKRARTSQARTQVELAQYKYLLPRLTRMWTHLEKQRGGIGMRGPGETEIETDRRVIRDKLSRLKKKLEEIDKQQHTQRKGRGNIVRVALVGYTNVGKSTLMNQLAKSDVFAENKLFATLDTTVRKVVIDRIPFLCSDTVGFIRKLPHDLVESFKSTLDEVREADILVHVVDISHPNFEEQIAVVNQTLVELGAANKPQLMVFNKIDAYSFIEKDEDDLTPIEKENLSLKDLKNTWMGKIGKHSIFISAINKENFQAFKSKLVDLVKEDHYRRYPNVRPDPNNPYS
ncbi:MAG: GTPase HflX [Bacteroidia bacterium]|nr:GTPase HflX [Bacteroidia bacterium]NNC84764.1 GTPase HflX [Bacteroidia bacterium]NNM15890.1 GTPase HflX [Bacteroidia bacterium]